MLYIAKVANCMMFPSSNMRCLTPAFKIPLAAQHRITTPFTAATSIAPIPGRGCVNGRWILQ